MLATYAAAIAVIAASIPLGGAVLWLSGRRRWSWIAPALGLAVLTVAGWLLVRLPGEGTTALIVLAVVALGCCAALPRVGFGAARLIEGAVPALVALLAVSIPFVVEGHFGIIGTGFNVDMSQHLFAADWIADPVASSPELIKQGYPVGPHALAVALAELPGGSLVTGFSGLTMAVPVLLAMTALAGTRDLGPRRGLIAALLVALPYLLVSYFAQGAFKELFEAALLVGFALWLRELGLPGQGVEGRGFALPGAVLIAGALYAYSGPGAAWMIGVLAVWALIALLRSPATVRARLRPAWPGIGVGLVVLALALAPEASRIVDFGGSAGNVADATSSAPPAAPLLAQTGDSDAEAEQLPPTAQPQPRDPAQPRPDREVPGKERDLFDDELGNLFGEIPALEVLGVWPSGDFRVEPGDGAIPAPVFYLGALLGALALAVGLARALREREDVLLAALAAALLIWLAALLLSTPYTSAKALQMVAPLLMLVAARGVLDARFAPLRPGSGRAARGSALAAAFLFAAAGSSALALANAPVGPERYTPGVAKLRDRIAGAPVLLLAPRDELSGERGAEFYGWELREADPACIAASPGAGGFGAAAPAGINFVVTVRGGAAPPFSDVVEVFARNGVVLWEVEGFDPLIAPAVSSKAGDPESCSIELG